jgi:hypothetical protein
MVTSYAGDSGGVATYIWEVDNGKTEIIIEVFLLAIRV